MKFLMAFILWCIFGWSIAFLIDIFVWIWNNWIWGGLVSALGNWVAVFLSAFIVIKLARAKIAEERVRRNRIELGGVEIWRK